MVLAVVVTAVMYEVGVAVTDPVPVPVARTLTLLKVCEVTEPPLLGDTVFSTGEREVLVVRVVKVSPVVHTASVFISRAWLFSNWLAWSLADIFSREETLEVVPLSGFTLSVVSFDLVSAVGVTVRGGNGGMGSFGCAVSRDATLVIPVVLTSREGTLQGGEVLT